MATTEDIRIDPTWTWVRGPVQAVDDTLVFDPEGMKPYVAADEDRLLWSLIDVVDDEQALRFARRYGPLRGLRGDGRESLEEWQLEAGLLHGTLHLQADISPARLADPGGIAALRARWEDAMPGVPAPRSDRALLFETTGAIVEALNRGLTATTVRVDPTGGEMHVVHVPNSLLGLAYLQLARLIAAEDMVRRCLECGRVFPVHDRRQRYCSERHASRARLRRFREGRRTSDYDTAE
jgi:hypothetical protein